MVLILATFLFGVDFLGTGSLSLGEFYLKDAWILALDPGENETTLLTLGVDLVTT